MLGDFFRGMISSVTVTATPQLYRYPYRTNAEALRGDMKRIGGDIQNCFNQINPEDDDDGQ